MTAVVGAYATAVGAVIVAVIAWRSQRRLILANTRKVEIEAGGVEEDRLAKVKADLDAEYAKRRDVERIKEELERKAAENAAKIQSQERRIARLEEQIRMLGAVPVNGG